jgi:hypothetical protein
MDHIIVTLYRYWNYKSYLYSSVDLAYRFLSRALVQFEQSNFAIFLIHTVTDQDIAFLIPDSC